MLVKEAAECSPAPALLPSAAASVSSTLRPGWDRAGVGSADRPMPCLDTGCAVVAVLLELGTAMGLTGAWPGCTAVLSSGACDGFIFASRVAQCKV